MPFFHKFKTLKEDVNPCLERIKEQINFNKKLTDETKQIILGAIELRCSAFKARIEDESLLSYERNKTINAYFNYVRFIERYMKNPDKINDDDKQAHYIESYYNSSDYIHVNDQYSYTLYDELANDLIAASIVICIGGALSFPFSLLAGAVIVGIALSLLVPTLFFHNTVTRPNAKEVRQIEDDSFNTLLPHLRGFEYPQPPVTEEANTAFNPEQPVFSGM